MTITAALVKELRDRTNAGMMECKKALVESNGDIEKAIDLLRKTNQVKAVKKASRTTAEGTIFVQTSSDAKHGIMVEINCETDFVAREDRFKQFVKETGTLALQQNITALETLQQTTEQKRLELVSQLGENVMVRRLVSMNTTHGIIGAYGHGNADSVRIGVLVSLKEGTPELARDIAMHIAAMNPEYLKPEDVPESRLQKEKEIFLAQTLEEGKPEAMLEKIVAGKLKKFSTEVSLFGQHFVKDPSKTIETLLKESKAMVENFVRFEVGEGITKETDNFVEEVMAQVRGQ